MTLAQMLGDGGLNLFKLPDAELGDLVERRQRRRNLDRAYATAAAAETGMLVQAAVGRLDWPLQITESMVQLVEYSADCYDYSCPEAQNAWSMTRDLCVFSGHYSKLEHILGPSPGRVLATNAVDAYRRVERSPWELVLKDNDPDGIAKRIAVLLWHIKARIILGTTTSEDMLADDVDAASKALQIPILDTR